jgi:hypothetical protein
VRALKAQDVSAEIEQHERVGHLVLVPYEELNRAEGALRGFKGKLDWKVLGVMTK